VISLFRWLNDLRFLIGHVLFLNGIMNIRCCPSHNDASHKKVDYDCHIKFLLIDKMYHGAINLSTIFSCFFSHSVRLSVQSQDSRRRYGISHRALSTLPLSNQGKACYQRPFHFLCVMSISGWIFLSILVFVAEGLYASSRVLMSLVSSWAVKSFSASQKPGILRRRTVTDAAIRSSFLERKLLQDSKSLIQSICSIGFKWVSSFVEDPFTTFLFRDSYPAREDPLVLEINDFWHVVNGQKISVEWTKQLFKRFVHLSSSFVHQGRAA